MMISPTVDHSFAFKKEIVNKMESTLRGKLWFLTTILSVSVVILVLDLTSVAGVTGRSGSRTASGVEGVSWTTGDVVLGGGDWALMGFRGGDGSGDGTTAGGFCKTTVFSTSSSKDPSLF